MTPTRRLVPAAVAALAALAAPAVAQGKLTGAGATFPNIIYQDWMLSYNQAHPDVQLNYQSIGSGGGIRQFSDGTVDFGATDSPMKDSAIAAIKGNVLHIPTVLGGDVPTYNLPDVKETLRVTPEVLADIFLGKITKWSDARIAAVNPGVKLPASDVVVVHRRGWGDAGDGPQHRFPGIDHQSGRRQGVSHRKLHVVLAPQGIRRRREGRRAGEVRLVGRDRGSGEGRVARLRAAAQAVAAVDRDPLEDDHRRR